MEKRNAGSDFFLCQLTGEHVHTHEGEPSREQDNAHRGGRNNPRGSKEAVDRRQNRGGSPEHIQVSLDEANRRALSSSCASGAAGPRAGLFRLVSFDVLRAREPALCLCVYLSCVCVLGQTKKRMATQCKCFGILRGAKSIPSRRTKMAPSNISIRVTALCVL